MTSIFDKIVVNYLKDVTDALLHLIKAIPEW